MPRERWAGGCRVVFLIWVAAAGWLAQGAQPAAFRLGGGSQALTLNPDGALLEWGGLRFANQASATTPAGEIRYADRVLKLDHPTDVLSEADSLGLTYTWPEAPQLRIDIRHQLSSQGRAWTWTREVQVHSDVKLQSDLTVSLASGLGSIPAGTWMPLLDGVGASWGTNRGAAFRFAGALPGTGTLLALPMLSLPAPPSTARGRGGRILLATDPYFSVQFTANALEWTYPARAGLENGCERRKVAVIRHEGAEDQSLDHFFRTLLPEVPPGPKWLHEIAMVDYDYMSDGGRGWFRDIDALTAALRRPDRHKVLLCLHGWYDFLGRYCFDAQTGRFDSHWTVFSSYERAKTAAAFGTIGGERVPVGFGNCRPVPMSLAEVHARLKYARDRGFRVALYFADGVNAGDGLAGFDPDRVLRWGGWQGPDSRGRSYFQNPLHPKVRAFFLDYTKALLAEFGAEVDALNWDETFHVPPGDLGSEAVPGYADRAMMWLVRDASQIVETYNREHHRQIALLTSDCLGAFGQDVKAPYALAAHGTFQDSWCQPQAWSYGIFANYRNVLWSCCWWPVRKWSWVDFGVRQYQAPVAVSNGWGDDKGYSEMTADQRARALALFDWRKRTGTKLHWFRELPVYQP